MQNSYAYYQPNPNGAYGMQNYSEPPPGMNSVRSVGIQADARTVYSGDMPPTYQPPPGGPGVSQHGGGTKMGPQQHGFA